LACTKVRGQLPFLIGANDNTTIAMRQSAIRPLLIAYRPAMNHRADGARLRRHFSSVVDTIGWGSPMLWLSPIPNKTKAKLSAPAIRRANFNT